MKFTFKKYIPTGRYRSFERDYHEIKLKNQVVGNIKESRKDYKFSIRLMVDKKDITEDGNPNCIWKNIIFKKKFNKVDEAKEWLNNNFDRINVEYIIHLDKK